MTDDIEIIYYIYLRTFRYFHILYRGVRRNYGGTRRSSLDWISLTLHLQTERKGVQKAQKDALLVYF